MEKLRYTIWRNEERANDGCGGIKLFRENPDHFLEIHFEGNLDVYFTLHGILHGTTFLIGKDDYEIYRLFDELYSKVLNGRCYDFVEDDLESIMWECETSDIDYHEELKRKRESREERRQMNLDQAYASGLIVGDDIIWRSDDYAKDIAPYFVIRRLTNAYELEFDVPQVSRELDFYEKMPINDYKYRYWVSVRLRNSGSRYEPFNHCFKRLYNKFLDLNPEYHQIHIEEWLIDEELKKGESLERILRR